MKQSVIEAFSQQRGFLKLNEKTREFLNEKASQFNLTFQEVNQLIGIGLDLEMWRGGAEATTLVDYWNDSTPSTAKENLNPGQLKQLKKKILQGISQAWSEQRQRPISFKNYQGLRETNDRPIKILPERDLPADKIFGTCPVASERTRCCNLITLDAVRHCGFDCSYCSIQTFAKGNEVFIQENLAEKLDAVKLDPNRFYHFGTGQASDSLIWGNQKGILDDLFAFARKNPNVLLELKTKSRNIAHLLKVEIPANVLCTWTITPPAFIENEEHLTSKLEDRIQAARKIADKGNLVGFHLHPIPYYDDFERDYEKIGQMLTKTFAPHEVALVSMGTLTFTKKVMNQIREKRRKTKILQMDFTEIAGKYSYPLQLKEKIFSHVYQQLGPWHDDVFFYLCMEAHTLWKPVFGYEYATNDEFEMAMKSAYMQKVSTSSQPQ